MRRAPSMNATYSRTLIRKTSLLRKIVPIARRSSFAKRIILQLAFNLAVARPSPRPSDRMHSLFTMSDNPRFPRRDAPAGNETRFIEARRQSALAIPGAVAPLGNPRPPWWSQTGSNRRPHACKARALPTELWPLWRLPAASPRSRASARRRFAASEPSARRAKLPGPRPARSAARATARRARTARKPSARTPAGDRGGSEWWAWEDLNLRPHAYQARALTN